MGLKNVRSDHLRFKNFSFIGPKRSASWAGWVALVIGAISLALAVQRWSNARDAFDQVETRLQARLAMVPEERAPAPVIVVTPEMETQAREEKIIRLAIDRDWEQLFGVLERAQNNDIALLTLQPDAKRGNVVLTGEARNMPALITYQRKLNDSLRDVVLTTHEVQQQNPQQPVRFTISAHWSEGEPS